MKSCVRSSAIEYGCDVLHGLEDSAKRGRNRDQQRPTNSCTPNRAHLGLPSGVAPMRISSLRMSTSVSTGLSKASIAEPDLKEFDGEVIRHVMKAATEQNV